MTIDLKAVAEASRVLLALPENVELARRVEVSAQRWRSLAFSASHRWRTLAEEDLPDVSDRAMIYVTGSMARNEADDESDLDLFVLDDLSSDPQPTSRLSYVEGAHLVSALDQVRRDSGFRPFSRGGDFIRTHSLRSLITETGSRDDDAMNTFTARILLLVNSVPLLNEAGHEAARELVLNHYWRSPKEDDLFLPIMLINDIRRWWGVVGLNFEHDNPLTENGDGTYSTNPKRDIANLKLRYARLFACYSVLLALAAHSTDRGLDRDDTSSILRMTPLERIAFVYTLLEPPLTDRLRVVLATYSEYLAFMSEERTTLTDKMSDLDFRRSKKKLAYSFHRDFVSIFNEIGNGKTIFEYSIV